MKLLIIFLSFLLGLSSPMAAQEAKRQISNITGDVYLFHNNNHRSLLVVTSEGVVRVDPINAEAGNWLNTNLATITRKPITHLIYSHSHLDHEPLESLRLAATAVAWPDWCSGTGPRIKRACPAYGVSSHAWCPPC